SADKRALSCAYTRCKKPSIAKRSNTERRDSERGISISGTGAFARNREATVYRIDSWWNRLPSTGSSANGFPTATSPGCKYRRSASAESDGGSCGGGKCSLAPGEAGP